MASQLNDLVGRWVASVGIDPEPRADAGRRSRPGSARRPTRAGPGPTRARSTPGSAGTASACPPGLRAWLMLSERVLPSTGPLIHPLSAIGPMVPFARMPDLVVQPESWFELGNPNVETVCIDLAYRWPGGGHPVFTSGDDQRGAAPG